MEQAKEKNLSTAKASGAILLAGSLWGSIGLFVRALSGTGLSSLQLVFLRSVVTAVGLFSTCCSSGAMRLKSSGRIFGCFSARGF